MKLICDTNMFERSPTSYTHMKKRKFNFEQCLSQCGKLKRNMLGHWLVSQNACDAQDSLCSFAHSSIENGGNLRRYVHNMLWSTLHVLQVIFHIWTHESSENGWCFLLHSMATWRRSSFRTERHSRQTFMAWVAQCCTCFPVVLLHTFLRFGFFFFEKKEHY